MQNLEQQACDSAVQNGWDTANELGDSTNWETARKWAIESVDDAIQAVSESNGVDQSEINRKKVLELVKSRF